VEPEKILLEEKNFINAENDAKMDGSETPEMQICFKELQAFSACFDAYAHGGNDVGYETTIFAKFTLISISVIPSVLSWLFGQLSRLAQHWPDATSTRPSHRSSGSSSLAAAESFSASGL
jgi:phosphate/sulfate permease